MGTTLKAGVAYFALVFGAGFALGTIRVLLLAPMLGSRAAELIELPVMLVVVFFAARWLTHRFAVSPDTKNRILMGAVALAIVLTLDFTVVLTLRDMTLQQYFDTFDPVAGGAYYVALLVMALMPWLLVRGAASRAWPPSRT